MPLQIGDRITGRVSKIMPFGAFVEIGSVVGLVKIPEISWQPIHHPAAVLTIGQAVEVEILAFGAANGQISLSIKRCQNPGE